MGTPYYSITLTNTFIVSWEVSFYLECFKRIIYHIKNFRASNPMLGKRNTRLDSLSPHGSTN